MKKWIKRIALCITVLFLAAVFFFLEFIMVIMLAALILPFIMTYDVLRSTPEKIKKRWTRYIYTTLVIAAFTTVYQVFTYLPESIDGIDNLANIESNALFMGNTLASIFLLMTTFGLSFLAKLKKAKKEERRGKDQEKEE